MHKWAQLVLKSIKSSSQEEPICLQYVYSYPDTAVEAAALQLLLSSSPTSCRRSSPSYPNSFGHQFVQATFAREKEPKALNPTGTLEEYIMRFKGTFPVPEREWGTKAEMYSFTLMPHIGRWVTFSCGGCQRYNRSGHFLSMDATLEILPITDTECSKVASDFDERSEVLVSKQLHWSYFCCGNCFDLSLSEMSNWRPLCCNC